MNPTIAYIQSELNGFYPPDEALELAYWIVEESTGLSRAAISACKDKQNISNIEIILARLRKKEPIQYIFAHTLWFGLDLTLNQDTLIPRPETAELVSLVLNTMPQTGTCSVLDIGTGSGAIALALKARRPNWLITALDLSEAALAVAAQNARRNNLDIDFIHADILSDEIGHFDIIVSNPPYITESEKVSMESNVLDYEPDSAIFVPDHDPLRFYRRIASLKAADFLFFEINSRFATEVAQLLRDYRYTGIGIYNDMYGKQRMVAGRIKV